jgi:hypothetical protein
MMLGVRRAGITEALASLERDGAVRREHGSVEIADRAVLERRACECYGIIAGEFQCLFETRQSRQRTHLATWEPTKATKINTPIASGMLVPPAKLL